MRAHLARIEAAMIADSFGSVEILMRFYKSTVEGIRYSVNDYSSSMFFLLDCAEASAYSLMTI